MGCLRKQGWVGDWVMELAVERLPRPFAKAQTSSRKNQSAVPGGRRVPDRRSIPTRIMPRHCNILQTLTPRFSEASRPDEASPAPDSIVATTDRVESQIPLLFRRQKHIEISSHAKLHYRLCKSLPLSLLCLVALLLPTQASWNGYILLDALHAHASLLRGRHRGCAGRSCGLRCRGRRSGKRDTNAGRTW